MNKYCTKKKCFSSDVIKRLCLYLRDLKIIKEEGKDSLPSSKLSQLLGISPEQFRKDLSYFGEFGKRGVGYNIENLIEKLEEIIQCKCEWKVALIGVGKLGNALLEYPGFINFGLKIAVAYDVNPQKIGKTINGIKISDINSVKDDISRLGIGIGVLCVPANVVQSVVDKLYDFGIRAILNFAPSKIIVPDDMIVSNVDMAVELKTLGLMACINQMNNKF